LTQASSHCEPDAKILKRQARALGVLSHRSAGEDKEHCDISRLKISPIIRKHSATKPVEILKRATARKNKVRSRRPTSPEHAGSLVVGFGIDASCQSKPNMTLRRAGAVHVPGARFGGAGKFLQSKRACVTWV
jgi:hypothetical protein